MTQPQPYDHVRAGEDAPIPTGTYRVVGTGEEVVLLRVGDGTGRRETTGETVRVDRATYGTFEAAENPDAGFSPGNLVPPVGAWATAIRHWLPF